MPRRRHVLGAALGTGLSGLLGGCEGGEPPANAPPALEHTVRWLIDTPRELVAGRAAAELRAGLATPVLRAANLVACAITFPYADHPSLGGAFHAVPAIDVGRHLADALPGDDTLVGTLLALDEFKAAVDAFESRTGDGPALPQSPEVSLPSASDAAAVLAEALEAHDPANADAAATALLRAEGPHAPLEIARAYAQRENHSDGEHRSIHVYHLTRLFDAITDDAKEVAVRGLLRAISGRPDGDDATWDAARAAGSSAPSEWHEGATDVASSEALWSTMRGGDVNQTIDAVVRQLERGGARAAWDAVLMAAAEVVLLGDSGALFDTTHALTGAVAARAAYLRSSTPSTRRLSLFMAAGRVAERHARVPTALDLAALTGSPGASLSDVFAGLESSALDAAQALVGYVGAGGDRDAFVARARTNMLSRAGNIHDIKYPEAVFGVAPDLPSGWSHRFLAASLVFVPRDGDATTDAYRRITAALSG